MLIIFYRNMVTGTVEICIFTWWCPSVNFFKFQPCDLLVGGGKFKFNREGRRRGSVRKYVCQQNFLSRRSRLLCSYFLK